MVDLDSNPTKLIEVVAIGKQLLITRGALTTFSIANDVAKYFAIIPAMFMATYPALGRMNIMGLHTPQSAVLSAVIFNALIIIALVPLALRGVKYRPLDAASLLFREPSPEESSLLREMKSWAERATSQLDALNEAALRETVAETALMTTVLVVAHRLSTVTMADRIIVMDAGRVKAAGTHAELVASDPLYAELAATQFLATADTPTA